MNQRFRRRNLPHWDVDGAAYFVTSCLNGSLPAQGIVDLENYREELARRARPANKTEAEWKEIRQKLAFARLDRWLDEEPAVRWLQNPSLAEEVVKSFLHSAGTKYDLLAFVVMPSHIHWAFQPLESWIKTFTGSRAARQRIVHASNTHTAREGNRILRRTGEFWQHEGYDHWIRDVDELERIIRYIENNPVKARLVESPEQWIYSSAHYRKLRGLEFGEPIR